MQCLKTLHSVRTCLLKCIIFILRTLFKLSQGVAGNWKFLNFYQKSPLPSQWRIFLQLLSHCVAVICFQVASANIDNVTSQVWLCLKNVRYCNPNTLGWPGPQHIHRVKHTHSLQWDVLRLSSPPTYKLGGRNYEVMYEYILSGKKWMC